MNILSFRLMAILLMLAPLALLVERSAFAQREAAATTNSAATPIAKDDFTRRHELFVEQAKKGNIDIVFMGDSITDGWDNQDSIAIWDKYYAPRKAVNFGIGGDRTEHVLWRITRGEFDGISPKVVVLMIGTNNTGNVGGGRGGRGFRGGPGGAAPATPPADPGTPAPAPRYLNTNAEIVEGVTAIVKLTREKLPKSKVLLLAIFPRSAKADDAVRVRINDINKELAKLDDGKMIKYLDINAKFLDAEGNLSPEIMGDYLHPNGKGYQIWADAMEPTLAEMLK